MKHSIRTRFTMIFIGLMAVVLLSIWCINKWYLEDYYLMDKQEVLETAYKQLDVLILQMENEAEMQGDGFSDKWTVSPGGIEQKISAKDQILLLLNSLYEQSNISAFILDNTSGLYISYTRDVDNMMGRLNRYILDIDLGKREILRIGDNGNYTIQRSWNYRDRSSTYLECWGFFSNNRTMFIMDLPLTSIRESVNISNRFLAYVGFAVIAVSSLIMYFTSKRFTKPILQLAALSERMSNLDFDVRYEDDAMDEIGILGNSMNMLSEQLKETIGELQVANVQLQKDIKEKIQIDEMRKEFIGNVSHELKTPIALIQGYAEGLVEGMADDKENRDYYCEVIMDEANKMNKLVRQLLTLNALESGHDLAERQRFEVTDLVRGVLGAAGILIQQKNVEVIFEPTEPFYVWGDEFKIEEVITNYVSNSLNHLDENKVIRITIKKLNQRIRVSVYNSGAPIPEEDMEKLWSKFYKVDKARTRTYGGSGIGLSIVKAIMESHGQAYGVRNMDNGVEFWFELEEAAEL